MSFDTNVRLPARRYGHTRLNSITIRFVANVIKKAKRMRICRSAPEVKIIVSALLAWLFLDPITSRCTQADDFARDVAPLLRQHCVKCHGENTDVEGDVNLQSLGGDGLSDQIELVRRIVDVLELEEMPPEDEPPLPAGDRKTIVRQLRAMMHVEAARSNRFSHTPIRRMNRFQYNNAVTDLFDLKCIVFTLPERMMREHNGYFRPETGKMADVVTVGSRPLGKSQMIERRLAGVAAFPQDLRAEHGYDNQADHLSLSPLLMESFLKLGQSVTQSPDFHEKNVGVWKELFAVPNDTSDLETEVRSRLEPFLFRAFRRPTDEPLLERYVRFTVSRINSGVTFTDAMKLVAAAAISSPRFLYVYDRSATTESAVPLDDFELAPRLSFFLWGSIPDQTLLEIASAGELTELNVLEAQFQRMLRDHKLKRFCDSFPTQWLQLDRILSSVPNPEMYPDFYFGKYRHSMHMMMEPLLLFETVLIENQSIKQLIDSDFTYRSRLLQTAYRELGNPTGRKGGGAVTVLSFHRVPVTDRRNGGVITNAAVMTMTSGPERTQPITRGAWLAGVIFNNPPEPPPANVPPLSEKPAAGEEHLTLRERFAAHRKRADCKGCHEKIDPLGFALENYDPIGIWRDKYANGQDIDVSGKLFRRHEFSNVAEFKDAILAEKNQFTRALAGHLLSFALARQLNASDQPALDTIVEATAADDYKIQSLLKHVILSKPFLTKTNPRTKVN